MALKTLTITGNGNSDVLEVGGIDAGSIKGGDMQVTMYAGSGDSWDGSTVKAQVSPDEGTTWVDIDDADKTADATLILTIIDHQLRFNRASAAGSTTLSISVSND